MFINKFYKLSPSLSSSFLKSKFNPTNINSKISITKRLFSYSLFNDSELSLASSVSEFAKLSIEPYVKSMDSTGVLNKDVLKALFNSGFMGIEINNKYGGSEMKFLDSCIIIQVFYNYYLLLLLYFLLTFLNFLLYSNNYHFSFDFIILGISESRSCNFRYC